ncbi:Dephospho-CoA kinase [Geobacillus sp. BCO2]|nr:Dephospho-CoA kinase [Geobacillus sp. BCO2]
MTLTIGLTGGIASGKSTVSAMMRELGLPVIDADEAARAVVRPGEDAYRQIIAAFGPGILQTNGEIDRAKLGAIVFNDEEERKKLKRHRSPGGASENARGERSARPFRGENGRIGHSAFI